MQFTLHNWHIIMLHKEGTYGKIYESQKKNQIIVFLAIVNFCLNYTLTYMDSSLDILSELFLSM